MANTNSRWSESHAAGRDMRCAFMVERRRGGTKFKRRCTGRPLDKCTCCSDHRLQHNHALCKNVPIDRRKVGQ